ncbi:MAG: tetratricopeptide repeat protein [Spirochaetia bacterium]
MHKKSAILGLFFLIVVFLSACSTSQIPYRGNSDPAPKAKTLNDIGFRFYNQGNYEDARAYFSLALKMDPAFVDAYINRSATNIKLTRFNEALNDASRALQLQPNNVQALNNRGNAYSGKNNFSRALEDYKKAYQLQPNFLDVLFNIANMYYRMNLRMDAVRYYTRVLEVHPGMTQAYIFRGLAQHQLGYQQRALEDFKVVLRMQNRGLSLNMQLARALLTIKRFADAEKALREVVEEFPDYADGYYVRAEVLYHLKDYQAAYADILRATELKRNVAYQALLVKIQKKLKR